MRTTKLIPAVSLLVPALAYAEPGVSDTEFDREVPAVSNAFELGISAGYSQGGGELGGNMADLDELAGPGAAIELSAGYRIIPHLSIGAYGTLAAYSEGDSLDSETSVLGASAGLQAVLHTRPDRSIDPWVSIGAGWRGLWFDPTNGDTTALQGLDLARLQVGADYRVSKDVAIAPVIGVTMSMFLSEDSPMTDGYTEIDDKKVNITGFAGISGRFAFGGER